MATDPMNQPRSRHLNPDGTPRFTNRLADEASPYLLQHAHNPVDWYPWGSEAFDRARELNRPVLLSVGYSTCHWCHVMEEESFEDLEVADFINNHYVPVKVDREERPDVDSLYMKAVQSITGGGGWPMTVWMTPDRKPFYAGTYFPARDGDRGNVTGFLTILGRLSQMFLQERHKIDQAGNEVSAAIERLSVPLSGSGLPGERTVQRLLEQVDQQYDPQHGGLKGQNKFPSSLPIRFLLRQYQLTGRADLLSMVQTTLSSMASGGINDHVGGGFHRYSTDPLWKIPHYEKMLYDNALLVLSLIEAWQVTGKDRLKEESLRILSYLENEMLGPDGGFFSATDADSLTPDGKKEEGYYFTWTPSEIDALFDPETASAVKGWFAVRNVSPGERQVLSTPETISSVAADLGIEAMELSAIIERARPVLYQERSRRPTPGLDDKIITSWNSLAVSAFARAGFVFDKPHLEAVAQRTAGFIEKNLMAEDGQYRSIKNGRHGHPAFLQDYAAFMAACLDLFETTGRIAWLEKALALDRIVKAGFEDRDNGGFFMAGASQKDLMAREKPAYDGATPSGNSVMIMNLLRLSVMTSDPSYRQRAEKALCFFSGILETSPLAFSEMCLAIDWLRRKARELVIVTPEDDPGAARPFLDVIRKAFLPGTVIMAGPASMADRLAVFRDRAVSGDGTVAYLCEEGACRLPAATPEILAEQLGIAG